jgi:hypothetical protein
VDTSNVALDSAVWTRVMWLWTGWFGYEKCGCRQGGVDTRNVALDRGCGHEYCGSGQAGVDTSTVALDSGVWTRVMWLWTVRCGHE